MPGNCARHFHRFGDGLEAGLVVVIVLHVIHGTAITFTEAVAEVLPSFSFDRRVLVHFMVVGIGMAMLVEIFSCSFYALVKTTLLGIAVIGGRLIPTVLGKDSAGEGLRFMGTGFESAGRSDAESEQGWCEPLYVFHRKLGTSTFMA